MSESRKRDARDEKADLTPLMRECRAGNCEKVEMLLKSGADPHVKNIHGMTAMMYAYNFGAVECEALLVMYGAVE